MPDGKSIALLVIGILLTLWGVSASESVSSGFSELFSGSPSDKAIFLIIAGALTGIIGLVGVLRGTKA